MGELVQPYRRLVRGCQQRDGLAVAAGDLPAADGPSFGGSPVAFVDPMVLLVEVEDRDVAGTEAEAGFAFPRVGEAVDVVELDGAVDVGEESEHAAAADGGELAGVADEHDAPVVVVGEGGELGELGGGGHAGLVDDDGGAGGQPVAGCGWSFAGVFVQQLGERVGVDAGLDRPGRRPRGGRRHAGHALAVDPRGG